MSDAAKTRQELLAEVASLRRQLKQARKNAAIEDNGAQAVLDNLEAFPQIVNFIKEVFYVKDVASERYIYVSPAFKDVFGAEPDVMLGDQKKYLNLIHPEDRDLWLEAVRIQKEREIFFNQEYRIVHPSGEVRWLHARSFPVRDDQGKVFRLVGIAEDITDEKKSEEKIEKSLASLSQAEALAGLGYFERNWQSGEGYWSNGFFKLLGLETGQGVWSHGDFLGFVHPDEKERVRDYVQECLRDGRQMDVAFRLVQQGGKVIDIHGIANTKYDDSGHPLLTAGVFLDITLRKQADAALRESEELFRHAFDNASTGVCLVDSQGRLIKVNDRLCEFFGYSRTELEGISVNDIAHPDDRDLSPAFIKQSLAGEISSTLFEKRYVHKKGHIIWGQVSSSLVRDAQGNPQYFVSHVNDITARKKFEQTLQAREALLNEVGTIAKIGGWEMDLATRRATWTKGTYDIVEIEPGRHVPGPDEHLDYYLPQYRPVVAEAMRALIEEDQPLDFEAQLKTAKGNLLWVRALGRAERVEGKAVNLYGTLQDITERKQAEKALKENEELLRNILDVTPFPIAIVDRNDDKILFWSRSATTLFGHTAPTVREWYEIAYPNPDYRQEVVANWKPCVEKARQSDQTINAGEYRVTCHDGSVRICELHISFISNTMIVTFNDITDRKRAEEELRKAHESLLLSEKDLRESQRIAHVGSWRLDIASNEVVWSEELYNMYGFDPALPPPPYTEHQRLFTPESWTRLSTALAKTTETGIPYELELETVREDGSHGWMWVRGEKILDATGAIVGLWGAAQDITERKLLEEERVLLESQLRQSQKMEAIGTLAGGVAHDFNNILSAIIGYTELSLDDLPEESPVRDNLDQVLKSSWRARSLVSQLLAYSRKQVLEMKTFTLNDLIEQNQSMLSRIIGEDIDMHVSLAPDAGFVRADFNQIEQVLLNLVANARDAMPEGGKLTIETSNVELDEEYVANHPEVDPGPYVQLAVSDSGPGIDEKVKAHIFDPFFTTKETGKGTGMGLATVYGIVKQHLGSVYLYSELGHGSTFKIYLPRTQEQPEVVDNRGEIADLVGGTETILLAEDETIVREFLVRILTRLGYHVLEAEHGPAAMDLMREVDGKVDLLLTDVIMPQMNGKELFRRLSLEKPSLKVLYISGYTDNVIAHHGVLDDGTAFLQKPLSIASLARKVRQVLDD